MHTGTAPTRSPSTATAPARPGPTGPVSCDSLPLPTERMRIGLLAPPWVPVPPPAYGGTESVVDRLARGLVQAGHEVLLAAAANSTCPVPHVAGTEAADGRAPVCGDASVELRHVITAYDAMRDAGVDVVHDHTLIGPLYRHRDPDLPVVVTAHGPFDASFGPVYRAMHGVPVVAISRHQASTAVGVPLAAVIHHGIDVDDVPVGRGDGGYACFLGRMSPEKGPRQAVLAARAAGVPLRMAAKLREPAERAYFDAEVRPLLGPDVEYVGELGWAEKLELLGSAVALLNPLQWAEPFGLVMIEALATGTPVVAPPLGSAPEIVQDGVTGLLRTGLRGLAAALPAAAGLDRGACRAAAVHRFGTDRMVGEHLRLYAALRDRGTTAPRAVDRSRVRAGRARVGRVPPRPTPGPAAPRRSAAGLPVVPVQVLAAHLDPRRQADHLGALRGHREVDPAGAQRDALHPQRGVRRGQDRVHPQPARGHPRVEAQQRADQLERRRRGPRLR